MNRRPVSSRDVPFFHRLAARLVRTGLTPNQISVASAAFGLMAGGSLALAGCVFAPPAYSPLTSIGLILVALLGIQLRLICNLLDGLMAVEGGLKTTTGEIYNDLPDRISDIAILVGAGYSASAALPWAVDLGWIAACAAVMTAYTRVLGASMKAPHFFSGPMAKQHRMFTMNLALIASAIELLFGSWGYALACALSLIAVGSLLTCVKRLKLITRTLN